MRIPGPLLGAALVLGIHAAWASPTLTSAVLTVSVDDVADFWLNGTFVVRVPYTPLHRGQAVLPLKDLCVFGRKNVLALRLSDTHVTEVGVAYALRLECSDGTRVMITSNEEGEHRCRWIRDRKVAEPVGWTRPSFDDTAWGTAFNLGLYLPNTELLLEESSKVRGRFLSASGTSSKVQQEGEIHLFRRAFDLDIEVREGCFTPTATDTMIATRTSSMTPTLLPTRTPAPSSKSKGPVPITASWAATSPLRAAASPTPPHLPARKIGLVKTAVIPRISSMTPNLLPTRTPAPSSTSMVPVSATASWTATSSPRATPSPPAAASPPPLTPLLLDRKAPNPKTEETLIFDRAPLTFYAWFVDPGVWRVEVFDAKGRSVRILFEESVKSRKEMWVDWDGMDSRGRKAGTGEYRVRCTLDGRTIRTITAVLKSY